MNANITPTYHHQAEAEAQDPRLQALLDRFFGHLREIDGYLQDANGAAAEARADLREIHETEAWRFYKKPDGTAAASWKEFCETIQGISERASYKLLERSQTEYVIRTALLRLPPGQSLLNFTSVAEKFSMSQNEADAAKGYDDAVKVEAWIRACEECGHHEPGPDLYTKHLKEVSDERINPDEESPEPPGGKERPIPRTDVEKYLSLIGNLTSLATNKNTREDLKLIYNKYIPPMLEEIETMIGAGRASHGTRD